MNRRAEVQEVLEFFRDLLPDRSSFCVAYVAQAFRPAAAPWSCVAKMNRRAGVQGVLEFFPDFVHFYSVLSPALLLSRSPV
jgi:hypothetical protein